MQTPPIPSNESTRLETLRSLRLLNSAPHPSFDSITALAAHICQTPIALISLVDSDRQWFLSRHGLEIRETSRDVAFCAHSICQSRPVIEVTDATADVRFADNPLVTGYPGIRFYAGAPLVMQGNQAMGTLCVIDSHQRELNETQRLMLRQLADLTEQMLRYQQGHAELQHRRIHDVTRHHELLVASSSAGLDLKSFVDSNYVYQYVNRTYLDYWGQQSHEIIGHTVADLMGDEQFINMVKPRLDIAMMGQAVSYEATIEFPRKGKRHLEVFYLPARDESGNSIGTVVRGHDVTRLREREEQLRATVSMLEHKSLEQQRFIHIISHDLKEPVNSINNFSDLLRQDCYSEMSPLARRYVDFVYGGGRRMKALLDDLTNLLVLDQHAIKLESVDLNELLHQALQDLSAAIKRTHGQIETDTPLPKVVEDPTLLRIALQNLLANALKFVSPGVQPKVTISAEHSESHWNISVRDNGVGIPSEKLNAIFDMFQRLHTRKEYEGTGLGLSICRRVIELHGGMIGVSSILGKGSCFTISLPTDIKQSTGNQSI